MLPVNSIYNYEVLDFIAQLDDQSIDLLCTDPPYNLSIDKWDTFKSQAEFMRFTEEWINAIIPKLKPDSSLYIFNTPFNAAYILQLLVSKGLHYRNWITWLKKDGFSAAKRKFTNAQETCLFFTCDKKDYTFNADAVRIPYESSDRIKHAQTKGILKSDGSRWFPNENGKLCPDVWHITSERHKNKVNGKVVKLPHPTQKPVELIERIIRASSNPGDLVVDPFSGSGTTAYAAKKHSRRYIGNDFDLTYNNYALNRLETLNNNNNEVASFYDIKEQASISI